MLETAIGFPYMDTIAKEYHLNAEATQLGTALIVIFIFFVIATGVKKVIEFSTRPKEPEPESKELIPIKEVDLTRGQVAMDFIDRLIQEKYNYYMYLELLPIYLDRKIPEKNVINKVKEKIYVSVVGSLSVDVKYEMLKFFTERGMEIYVNEKIVVMINRTDFKSAERFTESFREITPTNVGSII